MTTSNLLHEAEEYRPASTSYQWQVPDVSRWKQRTIRGYYRSDGQVGTRSAEQRFRVRDVLPRY